jgi:hypothetical protein
MDGLTVLAELRERRSPVRAIIVSACTFLAHDTAQIFACGGSVEKYIGDA